MWQPSCSHEALHARAAMLNRIRQFFAERQVLEVETPQLSQHANTDPHIQSMAASCGHQQRWLHTSPEFAMKRLLAAGSGDIFQICKVFRAEEAGRWHNPEFSMLEWYRLGFDDHQLMAEVAELLQCLIPQTQPPEFVSYTDAYQRFAGLNPMHATIADCRRTLTARGIAHPQLGDDLTGWLDLIHSTLISPHLGQTQLTFLHDYPSEQASLARLKPGLTTNHPAVAARFEVYYQGLELGNGFHELTDANEQALRFQDQNAQRQKMQLPEMPVDQHLIAALHHGLPDCSGVAIGLDRLLMLQQSHSQLSDTLTFSWGHA